jgi:predicted nucleotidyltransferase
MTLHTALNVPAINQRKHIPMEAIDDVVQQIIEKFHLQRILLFGSYARGAPRPESDVDILVVMESTLRDTEQALQICQQIEYRFGLDLLVISPKKLSQRLGLGDSFLREVIEKGRVLYESPDA